ncbi:hypothetical protein FIBSPDRAFT_950692 [Athelia psychrophila]|uniref:Uncharacterized protein n=1 Tax=Athelia psychrophila TaxID=1759441 RepID=A0A166NGY4_9AGAM|nr:hypothetical protein FIBSPDRAFT_950692 [Fibularhizoctonia sp. CBS 109695]
MQTLPPQFRAKHRELRTTIDSAKNKSVADILGGHSHGYSIDASGYERFNFVNGDIYISNHTAVCVYGATHKFYVRLGGPASPFGRPVRDMASLSDGSQCAQFEGAHIHARGDKADVVLAEHCISAQKAVIPQFSFNNAPGSMTVPMHKKWQVLCTQRQPDGSTAIEQLGVPCLLQQDNPNGGQRYNFVSGEIVSIDNSAPPYAVYGKIFAIWQLAGGVKSGWGRPLADEQDLPHGGRCSVFEGGHIHWVGGVALPVLAEDCRAKNKPEAQTASWNRMPPHFQRKWTYLSTTIHPQQRKPIAQLLGPPSLQLKSNPEPLSGQSFHFTGGYLISLSNSPRPLSRAESSASLNRPNSLNGTIFTSPPRQSENHLNYGGSPDARPGPLPLRRGSSTSRGDSVVLRPSGSSSSLHSHSLSGQSYSASLKDLVYSEPFAVYGTILRFWEKKGGINSKFGRPICDERDLPGGGRCGVFEGGHIHYHGSDSGKE